MVHGDSEIFRMLHARVLYNENDIANDCSSLSISASCHFFPFRWPLVLLSFHRDVETFFRLHLVLFFHPLFFWFLLPSCPRRSFCPSLLPNFSISLYIPFSPLLAPAPLTLECIKVKNDCFILSDLIINDDSCFELTLASSTSIPFSYQMIPLTYLMFINRACIFDFRIDAAWKFDKIQLILFKRPEYLKLTLKVSYKNGDNQILGFLLHEGNESSGTNEPWTMCL